MYNVNKLNGYGKTCVLKNGSVFESAGVNFSFVRGNTLPQSATQNRPELIGKKWSAVGVSLVIHPKNPLIPTSHANVRFFVAGEGNSAVYWFGGGYDLTPYYGFEEDCIHWHQQAKNACENFGDKYYPLFKKQCDDYFQIKHRQEPRGIGGLFFDDFNELGFDQSFEFVKSMAGSYLDAYLPIVERRKDSSFTERHKQFQEYRRGRYAEFNLVYDHELIYTY